MEQCNAVALTISIATAVVIVIAFCFLCLLTFSCLVHYNAWFLRQEAKVAQASSRKRHPPCQNLCRTAGSDLPGVQPERNEHDGPGVVVVASNAQEALGPWKAMEPEPLPHNRFERERRQAKPDIDINVEVCTRTLAKKNLPPPMRRIAIKTHQVVGKQNQFVQGPVGVRDVPHRRVEEVELLPGLRCAEEVYVRRTRHQDSLSLPDGCVNWRTADDHVVVGQIGLVPGVRVRVLVPI